MGIYEDVLKPFYDDKAPLDPPPNEDFFVVYVNMAQRGLVSPAVTRAMAGGPPAFSGFVHGVEYVRVYRVTAEP